MLSNDFYQLAKYLASRSNGRKYMPLPVGMIQAVAVAAEVHFPLKFVDRQMRMAAIRLSFDNKL